MTKSINRYFLSVFALTALVFLAACGSAAAPDPGSTTEAPSSTLEQSASVSTGDTKDTEMDQPKDQSSNSAEGTTDGTAQGIAQVTTEGTAEGTTAQAPAASVVTDTPPAMDISHLQAGGDIGDRAAEIEGITAWINSDPLTIAELRGKVVLVDFWTYTCINCIRTLPFLKLWNSRYADDGLVYHRGAQSGVRVRKRL